MEPKSRQLSAARLSPELRPLTPPAFQTYQEGFGRVGQHRQQHFQSLPESDVLQQHDEQSMGKLNQVHPLSPFQVETNSNKIGGTSGHVDPPEQQLKVSQGMHEQQQPRTFSMRSSGDSFQSPPTVNASESVMREFLVEQIPPSSTKTATISSIEPDQNPTQSAREAHAQLELGDVNSQPVGDIMWSEYGNSTNASGKRDNQFTKRQIGSSGSSGRMSKGSSGSEPVQKEIGALSSNPVSLQQSIPTILTSPDSCISLNSHPQLVLRPYSTERAVISSVRPLRKGSRENSQSGSGHDSIQESYKDGDERRSGSVSGVESAATDFSATRNEMRRSIAHGEASSSPISQTKILTDKACRACRVRKVKCDRQWPKCQRCKDRDEDCDFGRLLPVGAMSAASVDDSRLVELENRINMLQAALLLSKITPPAVTPFPSELQPAGLAEFIHCAFTSGVTAPSMALTHEFLESNVATRPGGVLLPLPGFSASGGFESKGVKRFGKSPSPVMQTQVGEYSMDWRLAKPALASALTLHLVYCKSSFVWNLPFGLTGDANDLTGCPLLAFFTSCCAYLPVFQPWHERLSHIFINIANLDAATRVAVAAICALGARASPHSALLGVPGVTPERMKSSHSAVAAGARREQACRSLIHRTLALCSELDIADDPTVQNLEALLVKMQMMIFSEIVPRKGRSIVRKAVGQFKDLCDAGISEEEKDGLVQRFGLPLMYGDSITAAYARRSPQITPDYLASYFHAIQLPNFHKQKLSDEMALLLEAGVTHDGLAQCSARIFMWISTCQRAFATLSANHLSTCLSLCEAVKEIWLCVDQIHTTIQQLQHVLLHLKTIPHGCQSHSCSDLHCRFITRLERDCDDIEWLIFNLVKDRKAKMNRKADRDGRARFLHQSLSQCETMEEEAELDTLAQTSENRVRRALKLVAFYCELYVTSLDPHQTYHLFWQLELLPMWTIMAVERFGESPGPASAELEVNETELDWLIKGLMVAAFYHPVAEQRLYLLQKHRRPMRKDGSVSPSKASPEMPNLSFPKAMSRALKYPGRQHRE